MTTCKQRLTAYLIENGIPFKTIQHRPAYTAHDVAARQKLSEQDVAKVVLVLANGKIKMLVLPAALQVDFNQLHALLRSQDVQLAQEEQFSHLFPDCQVGAMPPFGNLYGIPVFVDQSLAQDEQITFNAGTHTETMCINYADYTRLVNPLVASIGMHKPEQVLLWS